METRENLKPVLMSLIEDPEFRKKLISFLVEDIDEFCNVFKTGRKGCSLSKKSEIPKKPPVFSRGRKLDRLPKKFSRKLAV